MAGLLPNETHQLPGASGNPSALWEFQPILQGKVVQVFSDNTTAVCYLNKQGGVVSKSLCCLALTLWDFCLTHSRTPIATHLPGTEHTIADAVSRGALSTHELTVTMTSIQAAFLLWGTLKIDVFATAKNKKCHLFCTRGGKDPRSLGDGLLLDWTGKFLYMFPPLPLIPQVLKKFKLERPRCILVTPWWPRCIWFPMLLHLSRHRYLYVKAALTLLDYSLEFPHLHLLKLMAWLLS